MMKHIFILFRNQRKNYSGMFVEQMLVFVVLLYCFVVVGEAIQRYRMPGMLATDNVIYFYSYARGGGVFNQNEDDEKWRSLCQRLEGSPMVVAVTRTTQFVPYLRDEFDYRDDSVNIGTSKIGAFVKSADENTLTVFQPVVEEGHWLKEEVLEDGSWSAVITRQFADAAGWTDVIGKKINYSGNEFTVVGVISGYKHKPMDRSRPTLIIPHCLWASFFENSVLVKEGEMVNFRNFLYKEFYKVFEKGKEGLGIVELKKTKDLYLQSNFLMLIGLLVPTGFLLVFAFIGTFGIFWLYSTKRRKEFALRLVVGSTSRGLFQFVILEGILLTLMALVPGCVLFWWVYPFSIVNLSAFGVALGVMILFSAFSAWLPAFQVAKVNPVEAMREE